MQKLTDIQASLKVPKEQVNSFGKYKYRNAEDILEALKPLLAQYHCSLMISDKIEQVGERYYVAATATLVDNETEKSVSVTAYAREADDKKGMDASQVTGATSSYARKYALNGLFCIDDTKDADSDEKPTKSSTEAIIEPPTQEQLKEIEVQQFLLSISTDKKPKTKQEADKWIKGYEAKLAEQK